MGRRGPQKSPVRRKFAQSGVDIMITIFCDFSQFSAKKMAFFINTNVRINFFQNLALFRVKNANFFSKFFGENIYKIITSVPGHPAPLSNAIRKRNSYIESVACF
jgi:hypothetical protein